MQPLRGSDSVASLGTVVATARPRGGSGPSFGSVLEQQQSSAERDEARAAEELGAALASGAPISVEVGCDPRQQFDEATVRQLARILWQGTVRGAQRLVLRLRPDHLGELTLVLTLRGKRLFVEARSDRPDTLRLLSLAQGELAEALARLGLDLAALSFEEDRVAPAGEEMPGVADGRPGLDTLAELTGGAPLPPRSFMEVIA